MDTSPADRARTEKEARDAVAHRAGSESPDRMQAMRRFLAAEGYREKREEEKDEDGGDQR